MVSLGQLEQAGLLRGLKANRRERNISEEASGLSEQAGSSERCPSANQMRLQASVSEGVSGISPPAHVQSEHFIESTDVYEEMHMSFSLN